MSYLRNVQFFLDIFCFYMHRDKVWSACTTHNVAFSYTYMLSFHSTSLPSRCSLRVRSSPLFGFLVTRPSERSTTISLSHSRTFIVYTDHLDL